MSYLEERIPNDLKSAKAFWNNTVKSCEYPHLKLIAKQFLSAPASSCESERLFSAAKLIFSDLRTKLSKENFQKLLFLHNNVGLY
jgi:hypothetical protein